MATPITAIHIELTFEERKELEQLARSMTASHRAVVRARTILLIADGHNITQTARQVGRQRKHVRKWARRFLKKRLRGLDDKPRSGRPPVFSPRSGSLPCEAGMRAA